MLSHKRRPQKVYCIKLGSKIYLWSRFPSPLHIPQLQLTHTPAQGSHVLGFQRSSTHRAVPKRTQLPAEVFQQIVDQGDRAHDSSLPGNACPSLTLCRRSCQRACAVVASLGPRPLARSEDRSHHHTMQWNQAGLRSCFRTTPTAGRVFIQLRTTF